MQRLTLLRASFATLLVLGLALPVMGDAAGPIPAPDFCLGQCGPLLFPNPPAQPNFQCDGDCLTWLCQCDTVGLTDANGKLIGVACDCNPNTVIFQPINAE